METRRHLSHLHRHREGSHAAAHIHRGGTACARNPHKDTLFPSDELFTTAAFLIAPPGPYYPTDSKATWLTPTALRILPLKQLLQRSHQTTKASELFHRLWFPFLAVNKQTERSWLRVISEACAHKREADICTRGGFNTLPGPMWLVQEHWNLVWLKIQTVVLERLRDLLH